MYESTSSTNRVNTPVVSEGFHLYYYWTFFQNALAQLTISLFNTTLAYITSLYFLYFLFDLLGVSQEMCSSVLSFHCIHMGGQKRSKTNLIYWK